MLLVRIVGLASVVADPAFPKCPSLPLPLRHHSSQVAQVKSEKNRFRVVTFLSFPHYMEVPVAGTTEFSFFHVSLCALSQGDPAGTKRAKVRRVSHDGSKLKHARTHARSRCLTFALYSRCVFMQLHAIIHIQTPYFYSLLRWVFVDWCYVFMSMLHLAMSG